MDETATPDPAATPPDPQQVQETLLRLRTRADARRLVTEAPHSPEEVQRLVLELQTYQIELEMQNEELLLAQAEADTLRLRYTDLYEFAPVGYLSLGPNDTIAELNLCAAQLLAGERQRLLHRRFLLFVAPADRARCRAFLDQVLASADTQRTELQLLRDNGQLFFVQLEGLRRPDAQGQPQCQLVIIDTDERRRAADALVVSEARFRATFEQSNDGMLLLEDHRFVDANQAAARLLGLPGPAALRGRKLSEFWPELQPDGLHTLSIFSQCMRHAEAAGWCRIELQRRRPTDDGAVWDELSFNPVVVQGQALMHCVWRDITQQRRAHEQLRASDERQQLALRAAEAGVWAIDFGAGLVECDARAAALFGRPAAPLSLRLAEFMAVVHPADRACVHDALQEAIGQRQPLQVEHRVLWPDGSVRHVAGAGLVSYDAQGQPRRLTGLVRDTTAPHEAAQQLRREKEFSNSLLENSVDGIAAVDRQGRLTAWNARIVEYTSLPAAAALGRPVLDVLPHFGTGTHRAAFQRVLAGETVTLLSQPFRSRPGRYDAYLVPIPAGDAPQEAPVSGVLCIIRDVTERDRLAEEATQLRLRQQKEVLAAVLDTQESERKRIAEALHNGLGQLLYATKLNLEGQSSPAADAAQQLLKEAIQTTRRISFELTPGILEDFGLRAALEEIVKRIAPRRLGVRLHPVGLDKPLPAPVEIAVYRITQELLNNVMKHSQATEARVYVVREGGRLELTVEDNGIGFDPAQLGTKPLGGIGLTGVRNRVQLLGGTLDIDSRPGKGTIVSIELAV